METHSPQSDALPGFFCEAGWTGKGWWHLCAWVAWDECEGEMLNLSVQYKGHLGGLPAGVRPGGWWLPNFLWHLVGDSFHGHPLPAH